MHISQLDITPLRNMRGQRIKAIISFFIALTSIFNRSNGFFGVSSQGSLLRAVSAFSTASIIPFTDSEVSHNSSIIKHRIAKAIESSEVSREHSLVYEFEPWPHLRIFDGYLEEGTWVAGKPKSYYKSLLGFDPKSLDKIQEAAFSEGLFFPHKKRFPKFHIFSSGEALKCIDGKQIHFFGDSYIQQMFIGFGDVLMNDPSTFEIGNGTIRNMVTEDTMNRLQHYLKGKATIKFVMENCRHGDLQCAINEFEKEDFYKNSDVLIGDILVHHMTIHMAESNYLNDYVKQIKSLFEKREELHLTWATGPSYAINRVPAMYRNATLSRPTEYMNFKAIDLAKEMEVPLLDMFSLTHSCKWKNCTSDGGHRSRFVNRMKAQMILNNICKLSS